MKINYWARKITSPAATNIKNEYVMLRLLISSASFCSVYMSSYHESKYYPAHAAVVKGDMGDVCVDFLEVNVIRSRHAEVWRSSLEKGR